MLAVGDVIPSPRSSGCRRAERGRLTHTLKFSACVRASTGNPLGFALLSGANQAAAFEDVTLMADQFLAHHAGGPSALAVTLGLANPVGEGSSGRSNSREFLGHSSGHLT